jgi:hypothetical protein
MITKKVILYLLTISLIFIVSCSEDNESVVSQNDEIKIVSPNGGENWMAGTPNAITWTYNISDDIKIDLYKGGSLLYSIITTTSNGGQYTWTIPDTIQSGIDYRVKITSVANSEVNDFSDADFAIERQIQVLNNAYTGFLSLRITNTFPSFDETTQVDVDINKYGEVTFGTGTLSYSGDDNNGQSRIVRNGTIQLNPTGYYFNNNGEDYIGVDENATINENMVVYIWDGTTWVEYINENITDTWHGGLAFSIDDAVISGSIIQVVTSQGSVTWGLYLVVIP